jgi:hypothetical protein
MQPVSQDDDRPQSPPPTVDDAETPVQRLFRRRGLRSVASAPVLGPALPIPPVPPPPPPPRPVSLYGDIQIPDSLHVMHPNRRAATVSEELDEMYSAEAQIRVDGEDDNRTPRGTCCDVERGKQEITNVIRTFKTDIDRIISQSLGMDPTDVWGASTERQSNSATPLPSSDLDSTTTNQGPPTESTPTAEPSSPAEPVIHANVFCDMCREVIIGVRHKCLDCPGLAYPPSLSALKFTDGLFVDFDLCSLCLAIQPEKIGLHSKSHSLFAIEEPGGLWVHTVFSGEGTPEVPEPPAPAEKEGPTEFGNTNSSGSDDRVDRTPPVVKLAVHNATCDLCDSTIKGDRFVSIPRCTVRYSHTTCRNASTAQISIHARHATRSYPLNTHVTALLVCVTRKI